MLDHRRKIGILTLTLASMGCLLAPEASCAQDAGSYSSPSESGRGHDDVKNLAELVRQLQSQVENLNVRVRTLETHEKNAIAESETLRAELMKAKAQLTGSNQTPVNNESVRTESNAEPAVNPGLKASADVVTAATPTAQDTEERITRLEEDLALANSKIQEQSQTKVESSSKYRVRLTGLALFNLFNNHGNVDNEDFPQFATPGNLLSSSSAFGGSLRQSQIGLEAFGPDIAGAHTSADIRFDFAGGFEQGPNGNNLGLVRLRTGTVRFDWTDTSIIVGQDYLFFSPLAPTSYASVAIPALSYSGNLWGWTPQVRVEHRFHVSDASMVTLQGGILETLSGDYPSSSYEAQPTWGEASGQPAYAVRVSWSHPGFGGNIVAGAGGYYGRQNWGLGRSVDGWAGTADLTVPLGQYLAFTGQFYRGRAVGGLGGGIGQSVFWQGNLAAPATEVYGLDSIGGWVQLKFKPATKFEINGAFGDDNPYASELRRFNGNAIYAGGLLSKNLTPFVNFIYRPRSDLLFSLEYKHLKTFTLDRYPYTANHLNLSIGYIF
jgi:hypothetical protein